MAPEVIQDIEQWTENCMADYDAALGELESARKNPQEGEAEKIMYLAKLRRAERWLLESGIRADAASVIQSLYHSAPAGMIQIEVPEVRLKVKLEW